jgi:rapamycin-insensitive companion of mTOR
MTTSQGSPRLMEEAKLFTAFYHLSELRSREDLIKGIIENIDYSMFVFLHS